MGLLCKFPPVGVYIIWYDGHIWPDHIQQAATLWIDQNKEIY